MDASYVDKRKREYIAPVKVIEKSLIFTCGESLLRTDFRQVTIGNFNHLSVCSGTGYILLDFGREIFGGIRLLMKGDTRNPNTEPGKPNVRFRFGESASEAMSEIGEDHATNDHSPRDLWAFIPTLSDTQWGSTGYRFPFWYNDIPSYSVWFIQILLDYSSITGDKKLIERYHSVIDGILSQIDRSLADDGALKPERAGAKVMLKDFLDWPSFESGESEAGVHYLCAYTLDKLCRHPMIAEPLRSRAGAILVRMRAKTYCVKSLKQVAAFKALSGCGNRPAV